MNNNKRYYIKGSIIGLICGVLFGILITYLHEHAVYEIADLFGVSRDFYYSYPKQDLQFNEILYKYFLICINHLYLFPSKLFPFSFMGILILFFQYYVPPTFYGLMGMILGYFHNKIKAYKNSDGN